MLLLCELGETVAYQYEMVNDELCQLDWHSFPMELQQLLPTFMSFAQQPVMIRGYGNTQCVRETFKKVELSSKQYQQSHNFSQTNSIFRRIM